MATQNSNSAAEKKSLQLAFFALFFARYPKVRKFLKKILTFFQKYSGRGVVAIFGGGVVVFVFANILSALSLPALLASFADEDYKSIIEALKRSDSLPQEDEYLTHVETLFPSIRADVYADSQKRKTAIATLEGALQKNQNSRDILYVLSVLYAQERNSDKSRQYFLRAKAIDPVLQEYKM